MRIVSHLSETELVVDVGPRAPINMREARALLMSIRFDLLEVRQGETWTWPPRPTVRLVHGNMIYRLNIGGY
jgi:hypothetical protein